MRFLIITVIINLIVISGCSGGGTSNSPVVPQEGRTVEINDSHACWGLWQVAIDQDAKTLNATQLRTGAMHLNALPFLEPPPLVNLTVESLKFNGNIIEADIGLRHPFLGQKKFTGFDVSGIFITNGSVTGFDDPALRMAGNGDTRLLNPDGYSRWWNPAEFPVNDGTIFSYKDGLLGTPDSVGDFNSTLNAYRYYCNELEPNSTLDQVNPTGRGVFSAGAKIIRHYTIEMGDGLTFNYAVDVCWKLPTGGAPWDVPGDFTAEANRPEAWNVSVTEVSDTLYNDGIASGGELHLRIDVYDWFNADLNTVKVESPGNFGPVSVAAPSGGGAGYSTYTIDIISAAPAAAGMIDVLISVISEQEDFHGFIPGTNTTAYYVHTVEVFNEPPECPIPVPTAITGSPHAPNGTVNSTITCTNLMGTTDIAAYLDMAGTIDGSYDITGTDINNVDPDADIFDATFDLAGATTGYYYVVVTNSCGKTGVSAEPLFHIIEYLEGDIYVSNHEDFDGLPEEGTMEHPFHTINGGVNAAQTDDLILVDYGRGKYPESLYWYPGEGYVTVRASNWYSPSGRPTIGGTEVTDPNETIGFFHAWNVTIQGFKITFIGGEHGSWQMMDIIHSHFILIKDCFFTGDSTYTGGNYIEAIGFHWSYDTTIQNCLFKDINANSASPDQNYVLVRCINSGWSRNLTIKNCEFTNLQTAPVPDGKYAQVDPVNIVFDFGNFGVQNNLIHHIAPDLAGANDGIYFRGIYNIWPLDDGDPNTGKGYIYNNTIDSISLSDGVDSYNTQVYGIQNTNYDTSGYDIDIHSNIVTNITGTSNQYIWGIDDMNFTDYTCIWHVLRESTEYPWYNPAHEGVGCIYQDPLYVENTTEPYDYHLQSGSPCGGTGEDGEDMGCYGDLGPGEVVGLLGPED